MSWGLSGEPLQVQSEALRRSDGRRFFAYFMEMGLGKTATLLADFLREVDRGNVVGLIVICPNSLKQNWVTEVTKWGLGDRVAAAAWPDLPARKSKRQPFVHVLNFEAFGSGAAKGLELTKRILRSYPVMLAVDESACLRNHNSKRTKALVKIAKAARFRRVLSGAPVVRGAHDLWGQLSFCGILDGVNFYQFRNRYCVLGGFKGKQILRSKNVDHLNKLIAPHSFRAKKDDWLDLPPKTYSTREVVMDPEQKRVYDQMLKELVAEIGGSVVEARMALTQLMKLQQISSGFIIDEAKQVHPIGKTNPRMKVCREYVDENTGKVLIFFFYRWTAELLKGEFADEQPCLILGGMKKEEIEEQKARFNSDPKCKVALLQISSAKYGHTLLGDVEMPCSGSFFYENVFDLDARIQAEDRNYRIGTMGTVNVCDPIASSTDRKIITALQAKLDVAEAIVDGKEEE